MDGRNRNEKEMEAMAMPMDEVALEINEDPPEYEPQDDSPPSYNSLFGKVKRTHSVSNGNVDFICRIMTMVFCGTICCGLWIFLMLALPVACIVVGSMYLGECPREKYIPIYLIVAGCFGVVKSLMNMGEQIRKLAKKKQGGGDEDSDDDDAPTEKKKPNPLDTLISCFLLAWFIAGSVWIYRIYNDFQDEYPEQDNYCNQTLYTFAFWVLTCQYILLGLIILCSCALCVFVCIAVGISD